MLLVRFRKSFIDIRFYAYSHVSLFQSTLFVPVGKDSPEPVNLEILVHMKQ